jgi:hypothetical protein
MAMAIAGLAMLLLAIASWSPSETSIEFLLVPGAICLVSGGILTNRRFLIREEAGAGVRFVHRVLGMGAGSRVLTLTGAAEVNYDLHWTPGHSPVYRVLLATSDGPVSVGSTSDAKGAQAECDRVARWLGARSAAPPDSSPAGASP